MKLYLKYALIHLKSQMEYRLSFVFLSLTALFLPFMTVLSQYLLLDRFGNIKGWTLYEVIFCFSIAQFGYGMGEVFGRGFDMFFKQIRMGSFDSILVRPRSTVMQVLGSALEFPRMTRLAATIYFLWLSLSHLAVQWSALKFIVLLFMLTGMSFIYFGLFILRGAFCFWTVEGLEFTNILIDGGRSLSQYPLSIYNKGFIFIFTFIIPFASANYYPVLYLLGKTQEHNVLYMISPAIGIVFILPCLMVWEAGVRHYNSTG